MRTFTVLLLVAAAAQAADPLEARFLKALKADLATGKAEQTLKFIAPELKDKLSAARLDPVYAAWKGYGVVQSITRDPHTPFKLESRVRFIMKQAGEESHVLVSFNADKKIVAYWFRPAPPRWSYEELDAYFDAWSGEGAFVLTTPRFSRDCSTLGETPAPLGSIFKLYVLAELARQVDAKIVKLDQKVKVREKLKSFPSGVIHLKPDGAEVTVDELATKMIAISDNTATDLLIHLLGRENIEAGLERCKNTRPDFNRPFLTTREMFLIKGGGNELKTVGMDFKALCEKWADASREQRAKWVDAITAPYAKKSIAELTAHVPNGYALRSTFQRRHLTFEWHAHIDDIPDLLIAMWNKELPGAEIFLKYFAKGSEIYPREWVGYYGFKGGSETNVMAMCALAVHADGVPTAVFVCRRGDIGKMAAGEVAKVAAALLREGLER